MDREKVVVEVLARMTNRDVGSITPTTRLAEDLGVRSLDRIELLALLEERLGVTLSDREVMLAKTVADLTVIVEQPAAASR
jgi:acyl carrier protein